MKYLILSFTFILLTFQSIYSQSEDWQRVQLDQNVSIEFPKDYEQIDTLYQKITFAQKEEATFTASIFQANKYLHTSKQLLEEGYNQFISGALQTLPQSKIIEKSISIIDNLLCAEFKLEFMNQETPITQNLIVVFIRERTYSFSIMYLTESTKFEPKESLIHLRNSIDFNNLNIKDQI